MAKPTDILVIVDEDDNVLRYVQDSQLGAQERATLRRRDTATLLYNKKGELLIAQRHPSKRSFGGMWTVTCSGTVESHESYAQNATKELQEELGIRNVPLRQVGAFKLDYAGSHKRYTGLFVGEYNGDTDTLALEPSEVAAAKWISREALEKDIATHPERYVPNTALLVDLALQPTGTEYGVLVDQNDTVIGKKERYKIASTDSFRATGVYICNSKGELLLQRRSLQKSSWPGYWDIFGGLVNPGETYLQNARREAYEETGLHSTTLQHLCSIPFDSPGRAVPIWAGCFGASCDWSLEQFTPQKSEVEEIRWMPLQEVLAWCNREPEVFMPISKKWPDIFKHKFFLQ